MVLYFGVRRRIPVNRTHIAKSLLTRINQQTSQDTFFLIIRPKVTLSNIDSLLAIRFLFICILFPYLKRKLSGF